MILATKGEIEIVLQYRLLEGLDRFDGVNLHNNMLFAVHYAISVILADIKDDYPTFNSGELLIIDGETSNPKIDIEWWLDTQNIQRTRIQFLPLQIIERSNVDEHLKAYNRAMSIL